MRPAPFSSWLALDRKATAVHRSYRRLGLGLFARQILELFKASLLFFEEAILTVADQVLITRQVGGHHAVGSEQVNTQ